MSNTIPGLDAARSRVFRPLAEWVIAHRAIMVVAILAITGFLASNLGKLAIDSNPKLWAPQHHPYVITTDIHDSHFGGRNLTVIGDRKSVVEGKRVDLGG